MKEVIVYLGIRMYGPAMDTKPITLQVPCDTVESAHTFMTELLQELINEKGSRLADRPAAYDPNFGDDRICECTHTYERHFDSYENNAAVGCKYCPCGTWKDSNKE